MKRTLTPLTRIGSLVVPLYALTVLVPFQAGAYELPPEMMASATPVEEIPIEEESGPQDSAKAETALPYSGWQEPYEGNQRVLSPADDTAGEQAGDHHDSTYSEEKRTDASFPELEGSKDTAGDSGEKEDPNQDLPVSECNRPGNTCVDKGAACPNGTTQIGTFSAGGRGASGSVCRNGSPGGGGENPSVPHEEKKPLEPEEKPAEESSLQCGGLIDMDGNGGSVAGSDCPTVEERPVS